MAEYTLESLNKLYSRSIFSKFFVFSSTNPHAAEIFVHVIDQSDDVTAKIRANPIMERVPVEYNNILRISSGVHGLLFDAHPVCTCCGAKKN